MRGQIEVLVEEDHFACQIATILRRLPDRQMALAKIQIQQLLFNFEFSEVDASPPPSLYNFITYMVYTIANTLVNSSLIILS